MLSCACMTWTESDKFRDECGVFGIYGHAEAARLAYLGLYQLQHRGQESAGMAVSDGTAMTVVKDQGLVTSVFDDRTLAGLHGHLAIGHCRYSTSGSSTWRNAQPAYRAVGERLGERHAELDDVGAAGLEGEHERDGRVGCREAGREEGHERAAGERGAGWDRRED